MWLGLMIKYLAALNRQFGKKKMKKYPTIEDFWTAPIEDIREVSPKSLVFVAGGTRRKAIAMGISTENDEYMAWTRQQMITCFELIFTHGVNTIIHTPLGPNNFREVGQYRDRLVYWAAEGLAGKEMLGEYGRLGWRVRLFTDETIPALGEAAAILRQTQGERTLWLHVTPSHEWFWKHWLTAVQKTEASTRETAVYALYGEDVPPADIFLGHGKPQVFTDVLPVLGNAQCYWRQNLGYDLDERFLRTIFYDYVYTRATWRENKQGRAEEAVPYQTLLDKPAAIGLGMRLGPFWYPAPIANPFGND